VRTSVGLRELQAEITSGAWGSYRTIIGVICGEICEAMSVAKVYARCEVEQEPPERAARSGG